MQVPRTREQRLRGILGTTITVLVGLAIGAVFAQRSEPSGGDMVVPTRTTEASSPTVEVVPAPGQTLVSGTVTKATLTGNVAATLRLPLTLEAAARGQGNARIEGVSVGGVTSVVVWDAGQPLDLRGTGGLVPGQVVVEIGASGARWHLDGAARSLAPGRYTTSATVAVGRSGLATPRDGVTFDAAGAATVQTSGDVATTTPRGDVHSEGPGTVDLEGDLVVRTSAGEQRARGLSMRQGAYAVTLGASPGATTYSVDAVLQSAVTTR